MSPTCDFLLCLFAFVHKVCKICWHLGVRRQNVKRIIDKIGRPPFIPHKYLHNGFVKRLVVSLYSQ